MNITVPVYKIPVIDNKLGKLNDLAAKYGFEPITLTWGSFTKMDVTYKDDVGREHQAKVEAREAEITTPTWKLPGGWHLLAVLEHSAYGGDPVIRLAGDQPEGKLTRWHHAESNCDVCGKYRRRNKTVIIENATGDQMQVGTTCVQPFLGIDPAAILSMTASYQAFIKAIEDDFDPVKIRETEVFPPKFVMSVAHAVIRESGYMSRRKAGMYDTPTANIVEAVIGTDKAPEITSDDRAAAEACLAWMENLTEDETLNNDYLYNLKALTTRDYWKFDHFGLATAAMATWRHREAERKAQKENPSTWVGDIKKRLTLKVTYIRLAFEYETQWGMTFGHIFQDEAGNVFFWKTSANGFDNPKHDADPLDYVWVRFQPGMSLTLKATIKAHEEFRGVKQTVLTRCKVLDWTPAPNETK